MATTMQDLKLGDRIFLTPRVPQGLAAAVEGLTREVIRHQPENIYVFAAHHFEKLLHLREQYDGDTANKKKSKVLDELQDALKERQCDVKAKETNECTGWSLNETAKVLEKHRSIFGESGQKISTEEVRELANETSRFNGSNNNEDIHEKIPVGSRDYSDKCPSVHTSRKKTSTRIPLHTQTGKTPRIISQIPIAKDIKTELKRNRMSSKERRKIDDKKMQLASEYTEETIIEKFSKKTFEKKTKSHEIRSEDRKSSRIEECTKKKIQTTRSRTESWEDKKFSRSMSMDRVKNYVVQNFAGMTSLEDLQTPSYVEKVQEVIDETSSVIKEKVEALKTGIVKSSRNHKEQKKQRSFSSEESSKFCKKSVDKKERSTRETLQESVSPLNLSKESDEVFPNNAESSRSSDTKGNSIDHPECLNSDASEKSKSSLPAMRPTSSKSISRSQSARSNSDSLVLPPISPESAKSTKVKEDLVLPVLSPPQSNIITPDVSVGSNHSNGNDTLKQAPLANDEEFKDSLNATPKSPGSPQRPDSLESPRTVDEQGPSIHNNPLETLKDKLLEIEEVQKRIEGVLDDTVSIEKNNSLDESTAIEIQDKLLEIEETEKRIERILDSQSVIVSNREVTNSDIKNKLQELEDVEKRIESIFISEIKKETDDDATSTPRIEQNTRDESSSRVTTDRSCRNAEEYEENDLEINASMGDNEEKIVSPAENTRLLSPHSYILTEGSPYDIPDTVTTVIIPDRNPSPDPESVQVELQDEEIYTTLVFQENFQSVENSEQSEQEKTSIHNAFGEPVKADVIETSTVDKLMIESIKISHDILISRQDLDEIREEREAEAAETIDSEDEKVLKVVTSSLEEILENDKVEYVSKEVGNIANSIITEETNDISAVDRQNPEYESTDETKETSITDGIAENETELNENSVEAAATTTRSAESTNEIKETYIITDKSSSSLDPGIPVVPELNLDSLPDLTISSFNVTDDEQNEDKVLKDSIDSTSLENLIDSMSVRGEVSTGREEQELLNDEVSMTIGDISNENLGITTGTTVERINNSEIMNNEELKKAGVVGESELDKIAETTEEECVLKNENIESHNNDENNDASAETTAHSEVVDDVVNMNEIADAAPDYINNCIYKESDTKIDANIANENNSFDNQHGNAELSLKEMNNELTSIESNVIDEDHNKPANDSLRISSQCTSARQLESDELSIELNVDEAVVQIGLSQNTVDLIQKESVTEKSSLDYVVPITNVDDLADETDVGDKTQCHIYVPESNLSKDLGSSTESSTLLSAATKIQAGVRGFLTRRRLQSTQKRSSTLDSVPSIQESFAAEGGVLGDAKQTSSTTMSHLMPTISEAKARKKLRREDAVQRTTLSIENAFAENQLQHTGEFHDCIPLPVFDARALDLRIAREQKKEGQPIPAPNVEKLLSNILLGHAAQATNFPGPTKLGQFVDVVLLPGDIELQSKYLNFITSVEDVTDEFFNDPLVLPNTAKGVIIEEITSLDEVTEGGEQRNGSLSEELSQKNTKSTSKSENTASADLNDSTNSNASEKAEVENHAQLKLDKPISEATEPEEPSSLLEASIATSEEPLSMNIDEVLGLGEEDGRRPRDRLTAGAFPVGHAARSSSVSQESHLSDERTKSPITMMQIAPATSLEEKLEEKNKVDELSTRASSHTAEEDDVGNQQKEQQTLNENVYVNAATSASSR